ncbi:hypothetical protein CLG96_10680 [Sphingomonas oleivorans]|uniref:Uncharacterized protein n=2 Tax=Sphingomonas oleivorans TaxID=1735121 RepID=A0A2T5FY29_9SPHN|nr:hypothetical protein CLG96_10680 [Sphingomonas oleivorans]
MRLLAALLTTALIATPVAAQQPKPKPNPFSDRLEKLDDIPRRATLRRAILDSGQYCNRVDAAGRQQDYKNLVMWTARCGRGGDYALFIGPDASVQVRRCPELKTLGLPECRPRK